MLWLSLAVVLQAVFAASGSPGAEESDRGAPAKQILQAAAVEGGLVVHVGCGDGRQVVAAPNEWKCGPETGSGR